MGTALAVLLSKGVGSVGLWARDPERAEVIRRTRRNERHLPGVELPDRIHVSSDPGEAASCAEVLFVAIPTAFLRSVLERLAPRVPAGVPAVSVVKGIEQGTFARPSRIIVESLGPRPVAVLSGPSHAEEIVRDLPASVVVAGPEESLNRAIQDDLNRGRFRVYTNPDAVGVELAGALKNILGVAAGICEGLGFGDNAKAALLTRGLVEIQRFGVELGADPSTFSGLAGVGDVITTCFSPHGRNRAVGVQLGRGATLDEILARSTSVAEGVDTTRSVRAQAARHGVEMPITEEVGRILFEGKPPLAALSDLMLRPPKDERP
jgi:glycerol-3-phosphate dehydrogenase (NAD(P)+)